MSSCNDCQFFGNSRIEQLERVGECLRYPPTVLLIDETLTNINPKVIPTNFCGEWVIEEGIFHERIRNMDL